MRKLKLQRSILLSSLLLSSQVIFAKTGKEIINSILQDWLLPFFLLALLLGAIGGFIKNLDLLVDKAEQGTFWKGMKNIGIILGYVFMGLAILTSILVAGKAWMATATI